MLDMLVVEPDLLCFDSPFGLTSVSDCPGLLLGPLPNLFVVVVFSVSCWLFKCVSCRILSVCMIL